MAGLGNLVGGFRLKVPLLTADVFPPDVGGGCSACFRALAEPSLGFGHLVILLAEGKQ